MKFLIIAAFALFFTSCNSKNAHPEQLDSIYKDLVTELDIANKSLEEEEKNFASLLEEKSLAIPQTGQIKFANKKIADSQNKINSLKQQKLFFEIKVAQRLEHSHIKYEESLRPGGKPWPDQEEVSLYNSVTRFQRNKISWEKNKGMKTDVPRGTNKNN